jgi:hypothetical protein
MALAVAVAGLGATYFLSERTTCALGEPVESVHLVTPVLGVNAPFWGTAWAWSNFSLGPLYLFRSGSLSLTTHAPAFPNSSLGWSAEGQETGDLEGHFYPDSPEYSPGNWTVYTAHNESVFSPGATDPCTSPFVATVTGLYEHVGNEELNVTQNSSDLGEATQPYEQGGSPFFGPYVQMYVAYQGANYPSVDTCSTPGTSITFSGQAEIPIGIPFVYQGQNRTVLGEMLWQMEGAPTLSYNFPGYFGIWQIDSLAGNDTLGFLSFNYQPCPSG